MARKEPLSEESPSEQPHMQTQVLVHGLSFGIFKSRMEYIENRKSDGAFHSPQALKQMKDTDIELGVIIRSSKRRILLSAIVAFLSLFWPLNDVCSIRNVQRWLFAH